MDQKRVVMVYFIPSRQLADRKQKYHHWNVDITGWHCKKCPAHQQDWNQINQLTPFHLYVQSTATFKWPCYKSACHWWRVFMHRARLKCWTQGSIFIQKEGFRTQVEVLAIKHWIVFTLVITFTLWLGSGTKTLGQGLENIMVWLSIPVLVATITDGDGQTIHEKYRVLLPQKMAGNIPKCPSKYPAAWLKLLSTIWWHCWL